MTKKNWYAIGLMSGTSLDGLDLIYVKFEGKNEHNFKILKTKSYIYSEKWKNDLQQAFYFSGEDLRSLDSSYGRYLGEICKEFIDELNGAQVDLIASHGHTVFHRPEAGYTLQIGSGAHLAHASGQRVVCDFRTQDVALGGQGAPLVPIGDQLLFGEYDYCLNLGGFGNISYDFQGSRRAFDICPVNILLNHFTRKEGLDYDPGGKIASGGRVDETLLSELNNLEFYRLEQPKSLGYEYLVETVLPMIEKYDLDLKDQLRTCIEHSAVQVATVVNELGNNEKGQRRLLITGGGAFNDFLIERIRSLCETEVILPNETVIEFKEALIFALLGVLKMQNKVNCLKSVTGAIKDHSSGVLYDP